MTMLNGEPVEMPDISTGSTVAPVTAPVKPSASAQSQGVGFVVGLLALIFAFVLPLAGAIIGGIAVGQARQGGYKNPLATIGLVLGIVFTVLTIVVVVASIVLGIGFFGELSTICQNGQDGELWGIPYTCS